MIHNRSKLQLWNSNEIILWSEVTTAGGTNCIKGSQPQEGWRQLAFSAWPITFPMYKCFLSHIAGGSFLVYCSSENCPTGRSAFAQSVLFGFEAGMSLWLPSAGITGKQTSPHPDCYSNFHLSAVVILTGHKLFYGCKCSSQITPVLDSQSGHQDTAFSSHTATAIAQSVAMLQSNQLWQNKCSPARI